MYISFKNVPVAAVLSAKGVSSTVITLGWVSLLTDISSEMVAAVLPLFVVLHLGLSPQVYGYVEAVYQAGSVLTCILGGYLGDIRKPKIVAALGYSASAVCKLLLVFVTTFPGIMAVMAVDRAGKGLRTAPRDAMIADATANEALGRAFGVHRALDTLGALLGPVVAWLLLLMAVDDFVLVFFISFCFAALGVVLISVLEPERNASKARPSDTASASALVALRAVLGRSSMQQLLLITALLSITSISDGFLYLGLSMSGAVDTVQFPLLFVCTSLVYVVAAVPIGNLSDRIGRRVVFTGGYLFLIVAYIGAGLVGGLFGMVLCVVSLGFYYAATDGVLSALAAPLLPDSLRGTGLSIVQAAQAMGRAMGSVVFGLAWTAFGLGPAVWMFGAALALSIAVSIFVFWQLMGTVGQ